MDLPPGVIEIPLMYLSYSELLQRAKEEPEIKKIISNDNFWRRRLQDIYHLPSEETGGMKNPHHEYNRLYIKDVLKYGSFFQIGSMCLPLDAEDYALIKTSDNFSYDFIIGSYLGDCKELSYPLDGRGYEYEAQKYIALHYGDEKTLRELSPGYSRPSAHSSALKDLYSRAYFRYYTPEMIDHAIQLDLESPETIFDNYRENSHVPGMSNRLLEYFLQKYSSHISLENLREKYDLLDRYTKENKRSEESLLSLNNLSYEQFAEETHLTRREVRDSAYILSIEIKKDEIARKIIGKYLLQLEEAQRIREELPRKLFHKSGVKKIIEQYLNQGD